MLIGDSSRRRRNFLQKCECAGYWFPHRRTGGACMHGPRSDYFLALRAGLSKPEAEALLPSWQLEKIS